jgi:phasin family protein
MTNEEMQKLGKNSMEMALNSFGAWTKGAQAVALEVVDYSKKSAESSAAVWEKLLAAKSLEKAVELQAEYLRSSYEDFVAEATKLGELYVDLAKEAYRPFESTLAKAPPAKGMAE